MKVSTDTRAAFRPVKRHVTRGLRLGCPADGSVCPDLHVVEANGTLEAVLVTSTASSVRTTTSGYLDLVGRYLPHSDAIHWLGDCELVFSFPEACWK